MEGKNVICKMTYFCNEIIRFLKIYDYKNEGKRY